MAETTEMVAVRGRASALPPLNPHGEEARSAVSNHEAPLVPFILRDARRRAPQDEVWHEWRAKKVGKAAKRPPHAVLMMAGTLPPSLFELWRDRFALLTRSARPSCAR